MSVDSANYIFMDENDQSESYHYPIHPSILKNFKDYDTLIENWVLNCRLIGIQNYFYCA